MSVHMVAMTCSLAVSPDYIAASARCLQDCVDENVARIVLLTFLASSIAMSCRPTTQGGRIHEFSKSNEAPGGSAGTLPGVQHHDVPQADDLKSHNYLFKPDCET